MLRRKRSEEAFAPGEAQTVGIPDLVENGDERPFRDFMSELFAAASMMQNLRRSTARTFGLSSTELAVMVAIAKLKPAPSIRRIADHLHIAAPNVTSDVGKLVRAGLLEKRADEKDGRATRIILTESGRQLSASMSPELKAVNDRIFSELSREEMQSVMRLLRKIVSEGNYILNLKEDTSFLESNSSRHAGHS